MALTRNDRCDHGDGAAAQTRWTKGSLVLDECGHHSRIDGDALRKSGFRISDMSPEASALIGGSAPVSV